ncbi:MAG: hypothetical protein ACRD2A_14275, partial [Vicinamibacterales bacterium]
MSEQELIRNYMDRQDREFREWLTAPSAVPSASNPQPRAGTEQLGPPTPPAPGVWGAFYDVLASGVSGAKDVAVEGAHHVGAGLAASTKAGQTARGHGQVALGVMGLI